MRMYLKYLVRRNKKRQDGSAPIYLRISLYQKRTELSTGIFINPDDWDEVAQSINPKAYGALVYNQQLMKIITDINDVYNRLVSVGKSFDINQIKKEYLGIAVEEGILDVFMYYLNTIEANLKKGYSYETLKHYRVSFKKLKQFIQDKYSSKDYPVLNIDFDFLNKFDQYLKAGEEIKQNTAWNYHKHLRRVFNIAISLDLIEKNPYSKFKVLREETHREFLTNIELKKLEEKEIEISRLASVRDIFVFACYTGLSYADISKLSKEHIQVRDDGNQWINISRTKTKSKCMIPLLPNAVEIIIKYSEYPDGLLRGKLLPVLTNQKMNSYLKELSDICSIKKNLTMHMARHTFATTITLSNGMPLETVSKLLGHKTIKVTQIYAKVLENKISSDMMELKEKLGM